VAFGYRREHVTERDPVIRLWSELTGRTLAPRERTIFLRRTDTEVLRGLLMLHGSDWMRTAARRCLHAGEGEQVHLKLADWVAECHRLEEQRRWQRETGRTVEDVVD
jgi:hypothetical protein